MHFFEKLKNIINKFFDSIDTITTKLLMLVLCCITIPLIVVANFSTNIIHQSIFDNSNARLEINKKLFQQKYTNELEQLKIQAQTNIQTFKEKNNTTYLSGKNLINYLFKKDEKLSFGIIFDLNKNITAYNSNINPQIISQKLSKIISLGFAGETVLSTENIENNLFQIAIIPLNPENKHINSVLVLGKSIKNSGIIPSINNLTDSTIAIYTKDLKIIEITDKSKNKHRLINFQKNKNDIVRPNDFYLNFSLKNYLNKPVGKVYLGISKYDFIMWVDKNVKSISFIAIISLIVAIIIAALFARRITDPILSLKKAAESINLGNLDYKIETKGNDETVKLTRAFNQMVKNLERDERLRNNFVATLTHDLKVPILAENQTIKYLLKETYGPLTEEQKEVLKLMQGTNSSSLEMIGTLLEVYRYDCGNVQLFMTKFNLVELIHESINQIKSLAEDKKININIDSPCETINITGDMRDIKRLIHNLVSNSINHGINRGFLNCKLEIIKDKIIYEPKSDRENYTSLKEPIEISNSVLISIKDNGIGIQKEDIPYLFKRFSLSKGRKPAGSGLGLYYSNQVVKSHKGHIWVESSENGGTEFKFTLPLS